jgi:hypothetical protein
VTLVWVATTSPELWYGCWLMYSMHLDFSQ